ncbi:hypothetical protein BB560_005769 [Smittium megazygosporum]|uniref:PB1 domain-containing protein n=1 Tax=Smittium megazygosporum TaxID=133381 RepID=A0A2T9YXR6_9FUNG|nr:hypothetical protein BB560_005769 [Smittium megazygosporum]
MSKSTDPVVIKFIYKGPEYYRYYWSDRSNVEWAKLVNGLRVLFGIPQEVLILVYKDSEGENILITNQFDLQYILNARTEPIPTSFKVMVVVGSVQDILQKPKTRIEAVEVKDTVVSMPDPSSFLPGLDKNKNNSGTGSSSSKNSESKRFPDPKDYLPTVVPTSPRPKKGRKHSNVPSISGIAGVASLEVKQNPGTLPGSPTPNKNKHSAQNSGFNSLNNPPPNSQQGAPSPFPPQAPHMNLPDPSDYLISSTSAEAGVFNSVPTKVEFNNQGSPIAEGSKKHSTFPQSLKKLFSTKNKNEDVSAQISSNTDVRISEQTSNEPPAPPF